MWFFRKKQTLEESGFFRGFTDWHCHLLPGVDDGVQTMEETLQVLTAYERLGVKEVWLTPHIMEDYPNTTDALRSRFDDLGNAYTGKVQLRLAAEYMIDSLFLERWGKRDLLTMGEKNVLVETRCLFPPMEMEGVLGEMLNAGYRPILAHPERYRYMDKARYRRIKGMGVKFQLNLGSAVGGYGKEARNKAEWLLEEGMYDLMGSDVHTLRFYDNMVSMPLPASVAKRIAAIPNQM